LSDYWQKKGKNRLKNKFLGNLLSIWQIKSYQFSTLGDTDWREDIFAFKISTVTCQPDKILNLFIMQKNIFTTVIALCLLYGTNTLIAQEGILSVTGNFTMLSTATFETQLKDLTGPGTGHDKLAATGNITLAGTLNIILNGYTPTTSGQFEIISFGGTRTGTFTTINWPAAMVSQGWAIDYGTLAPGKITIYGPASALPVELTKFTVEQKEKDHEIYWETASETNNAYFILEHRIGNGPFEQLHRINSTGDSKTLKRYSFIHANPAVGMHYYRLRQVDLDQKEFFSQIISLRSGDVKSAVNFYPNPTSTGLIFFDQEVTKVAIVDQLGKVVVEKEVNGRQLNIAELPAGIYMLKIDEYGVKKQLIIHQK
jgi:Secretion system C-terminal sorting domain